MDEKYLSIDDINFVDAVFAIPENAVEIVINVKSYENGEVVKTEGTYDFQAIRKAIDLFQQTIAGDYPKFVITEEGKKWLAESFPDT